MEKNKRQLQFEYVLGCINSDDEKLVTPEEKLGFFVECFHSEFDRFPYRGRRPNLQARITEYLQGLPSCCNVAFDNWDIGDIGEEWGVVKTERQRARFINNWWSCIALLLIRLCKHYGIEFPAEAGA